MEDNDESLITHLEALRTTLIRCFVALGIGLIPLFLFAPYFMDCLIKIMIGKNNISLNYFSYLANRSINTFLIPYINL